MRVGLIGKLLTKYFNRILSLLYLFVLLDLWDDYKRINDW